MDTGSTSGIISVTGGTQLCGVIAALYLSGSSNHAELTIVCLGTGAEIGAVGVSSVRAAGVKCGDLGGGTAKAFGMPDCTGMSKCTGMPSGMVETTIIVEDCTEMAESS
jgi:hypothetical protein